MTYNDFIASIAADTPPADLSVNMKVLWYDAKNNWDRAHDIAQGIQGKTGSWLHAYLHRKEGDAGNAAYWYHKAGKPMPQISLEEEWEKISRELGGWLAG